MKKRYLDANIFIYPVLYESEDLKYYERLFLDIINKKILGITSLLTWDELVHSIWKKRGRYTAIIEGKKFLNMPNLIFIGANMNIINKAQELIKKYNIKPRDAIHVATALLNNINEIISDDKDFDKIKEIKRIRPEDFLI